MTPTKGSAALNEITKLANRVAKQQRTTDSHRAELYAAIAAARELGFSTRQIATVAGISQPRVVQIVKEVSSAQTD